VLLTQVEMAISIRETTFAKFLFVLPSGLAGFEVLTGPAFAVGVAINAIANENDAAMMIHYDFVGINFFDCELSASFGNLEEVIADAITGSDINIAVMEDGRRNHGDIASARS